MSLVRFPVTPPKTPVEVLLRGLLFKFYYIFTTLRIKTSNIKRLRDALIDKEIIEVTENGLIIGDPILRLWLKKLLR